jgi:hypothetical protein
MSHVVTSGDGRYRTVAMLAIELLDLDLAEADVLFDEGNSLLKLWVIASVITDDEIQVPPELMSRFRTDTGYAKMRDMVKVQLHRRAECGGGYYVWPMLDRDVRREHDTGDVVR